MRKEIYVVKVIISNYCTRIPIFLAAGHLPKVPIERLFSVRHPRHLRRIMTTPLVNLNDLPNIFVLFPYAKGVICSYISLDWLKIFAKLANLVTDIFFHGCFCIGGLLLNVQLVNLIYEGFLFWSKLSSSLRVASLSKVEY